MRSRHRLIAMALVMVAAVVGGTGTASQITSQLLVDPALRAAVLLELSERLADGSEDVTGHRHLAESGSLVPSVSAPPPAPEYHSFFETTCAPGKDPLHDHCVYWDWSWTGAWLIVLVILTVSIACCPKLSYPPLVAPCCSIRLGDRMMYADGCREPLRED